MGYTPPGLRQYQWLTWVAMILLCLDLCINSCFILYSQSTLISLLIYIIQDVCHIFLIILLAVASFSTSFIKTGLMGETASRLKWSVLGLLLYLGLSLSFHTLSLQQQWHQDQQMVWTDPMLALYSLQRIAAGGHYFLYKRAMLRLCDEKYYR